MTNFSSFVIFANKTNRQTSITSDTQPQLLQTTFYSVKVLIIPISYSIAYRIIKIIAYP